MTRVIRETRPEDVKQNAKHVLFVEGHDKDSLDPLIFEELFEK